MIERVDSFDSLSVNDIPSDITRPQNFTKHPDYTSGTADWLHLSADFQSSASKGLGVAFEFISQSSNPNKVTGMFSNLLSFVKDQQMALNRNCTYCSKAVDRNLDALAREDFNHYYVATETAQGSISTDVENIQSKVLSREQPLTWVLSELVPKGERAIITVPVKDKGYSHAMNFIHNSNGCVVIDGQFNKVYNFNHAHEREKFDSKYGAGEGSKPAITSVWNTGSSPESRDEPFEVIDKKDVEYQGWQLV
ncbi:hypothetical protein [Vibrio pectenicida]|uniref:Tox-PL domain-containing protein n=1 Tax=Vibrio pectenicida TaxID=62763 RepID=A0A427U3G0_9VIBR|nr:hypothetical protein [Vibrio pectenicida]RSD31201.1 hypothetical protein EJA03_10065 [Vibrio pectenicida]